MKSHYWLVTNKANTWVYRNKLWPTKKVAEFWANIVRNDDFTPLPILVRKIKIVEL